MKNELAVNKKLKILVFSTIPTHPQDMGCRRRVYNLLDEFQKQNCEIHIIYYPLRGAKLEKMMREMRNKWDGFYVVPGKIPFTFSGLINGSIVATDRGLGSLGKFVKRKFPKKYKSIKSFSSSIQKITRFKVDFRSKKFNEIFDFCYDKKVFDFVKKKSREINPDIFICEYSWYSFVLDAVDSNVLKLIDTHDSFTKFAKLHRDKINLKASVEITEEIEKFFLQRADLAIAIQDKEKIFFENLIGKGRAITIGHVIEIKKNKLRKNRNSLLFVGSDWNPNIQGIEWFMKEVWPILKKKKKNVKLRVYGDVAKAMDAPKEVIKISKMYDLDKAYAVADVSICPIKIGSGLKIKAIEALGQGRPVVAANHVSEGFGSFNKNSKLFFATDDPIKYADEIISLLENNELYERRQRTGWAFSDRYNKIQRKRIKTIVKLGRKKMCEDN